MQRDLDSKFIEVADVRMFECPWKMRPLSMTFWWDGKHEHDPAHRWLRSQIEQCMNGSPA